MLSILIIVALSAACTNRDRLIDSAVEEFHRRWAARQFHEIYVTSAIPAFKARRGITGANAEAQYVSGWSRMWRDDGVFRADRNVSEIVQDGGLDHVTQYRSAQYSRRPAVEEFTWAIEKNTLRLLAFNLKANAELQCQRRLLSPNCQTVFLGPVAPTLAPGESIWSFRQGYETATCELLDMHAHVEWQTLVFKNGELQIRRRSGTHTEALKLAKQLRVDFERPGWEAVGGDRN